MIESKLEELFNSIENSTLYKEYKKMENILNKDSEIKGIIDEIRKTSYLFRKYW